MISAARRGLFLAKWLNLVVLGGQKMVAYKPPKCGLFWWKFWLILAYFGLSNQACLRPQITNICAKKWKILPAAAFFIFIFFRLQFLGQGSMCLLPISNSLTSPSIKDPFSFTQKISHCCHCYWYISFNFVSQAARSFVYVVCIYYSHPLPLTKFQDNFPSENVHRLPSSQIPEGGALCST